MKIVVLVKEVPDTNVDRKFDLTTGLADRGATEAVLDEIGERALEVALAHSDKNPDTEVVVLSMGPQSASASLRKTLAMGADTVVQVVDDSLLGADLSLTAEVLATALARIGFDLIIAGNRSTDGSGGVIPAMVAERLGIPYATNLETVTIGPREVRGQRSSDGARLSVAASLPAVISVTESLPDARFPSFKGIMKAKKKPLKEIALSELGITVDTQDAARSIVTSVSERPPRSAGVKIIDDGKAAETLAEFLVKNRLV